MAASPYWKVYSPAKEYVASCKYPSDAAALVAAYGEGATIRIGHRVKDIVFTEGEDGVWASESYDRAAEIANTVASQRGRHPREWNYDELEERSD